MKKCMLSLLLALTCFGAQAKGYHPFPHHTFHRHVNYNTGPVKPLSEGEKKFVTVAFSVFFGGIGLIIGGCVFCDWRRRHNDRKK